MARYGPECITHAKTGRLSYEKTSTYSIGRYHLQISFLFVAHENTRKIRYTLSTCMSYFPKISPRSRKAQTSRKQKLIGTYMDTYADPSFETSLSDCEISNKFALIAKPPYYVRISSFTKLGALTLTYTHTARTVFWCKKVEEFQQHEHQH